MDEFLSNKPTNSCSHSINSIVKEKTNVSLDTSAEIENEKQNEPRQKDKQLKREYMLAKMEEYKRRRDEQLVKESIKREQLEVEKKKIKLLEEYLKKK